MIDITNNTNIEEINSTDLFICCVGYEERSFCLYDKYNKGIDAKQQLVLTINDYELFDSVIQEKIHIIEKNVVNFSVFAYEADSEVQSEIIRKVKEIKKNNKNVQIDIDYSSMPRSWYCKLPELFSSILTDDDVVNFWYTEGKYIESADVFSTVGIESYRVYSGRSSLNSQRSRTHIIGVGFDSVRTQGILSIIDPDNYVICNAYDPNREDIHNDVMKANASVIEQTSITMSLFVNDIELILAKLKGLINELFYASESDVILVPDGPKPLIFCMSMMPWIIGKEGITCLHILRNSNGAKRINVFPGEKVIGFSVKYINN